MKLLVQWQPDPNTVANCKQVPDDFKEVPDGWELLSVAEFNKRAEPLQAEVTRRKLERLEAEKIEQEEAAAKFEEVKEDPVTKTDVTDTEAKLQTIIDSLEARLAALEAKLK
jgi:uncharacterized small protein (DUF1192 family)